MTQIYEWLSPTEISELEGMPSTIQGVHKKASREGWQKRKKVGVQGPGVEYEVPLSIQSTKDIAKNSAMPTSFEEIVDQFVLIPGYSIQVSAGHGALPPEFLEPSRFLAFRKKWLQFRGFREKALVIVWAKGDSKEPTINNNDTLVINTDRKTLSDGNIFVLRYGDNLWVKRVQTRTDSCLLISDNTVYPPMNIPHSELHTFEVVGQVVHISKDIGD